jgi:xanthine dehydrogenase accessory factor
MVMATVVRTAGPTYSKPGALMLICGSGEYDGVLSGGCLEGDLAERSRAVLASGVPRLISYDMRGPDDLLFGLGSGCEGAMDILLQRLDAAGEWQPMQRLAQAWNAQRAISLALVTHSNDSRHPVGAGMFGDDGAIFGAGASHAADLATLRAWATLHSRPNASYFHPQALPGVDLLVLYQPPPPQILLLGAGPDAQPVVHMAALLGWRTTVIDHRPHYARAERLTGARAVLDTGPSGLTQLLQASATAAFDVAIVMSHHFASDLAYLGVLADTEIPYVGLLGPVVRRERLLADLGSKAAKLRPRLRAPIGLDLGAVSPESIALAIVAEIQGTLAGRESMGPMSRRQA